MIGSGRLFIDRVVRRTQKASKEGLCKSLHSTAPAAKLVAAAAARRVERGVAQTGGGTSSSSLDTLRRLLPQLFSDFANSIQRPFKTAAATIIAKRGSSQASKACTIVPNQHHHSLTKKSLKEGPQPNVQVPFLLIQYYRGMHHLHNCQCLY